MKKLRRILVAISDLDRPHGGVLRRAAVLARATGARVELFHALTGPVSQPRKVGRQVVSLQLTTEESLEVVQKDLERIARSKLLEGIRVQAVTVADRPVHEAIVRRATTTRADLVITGTHSRGFANRLILRHTDWELVRHSPAPLLLVKSERPRAKPVVLAAIDPLHANAKPARLDARILDVAEGMATLLRGPLHVVHAYMPLSIMLAASIGEPVAWNTAELDTDYTQRVAREFALALRSVQIPTARRHLRLGTPAAQLVGCAARIRASLVVMGAVSRSGLERLFVGSTAEHALDELPCDVLIVKPRGHRRPAGG